MPSSDTTLHAKWASSPIVNIDCIGDDVTNCEGYARREIGYTTLITRVSLNPTKTEEGSIKTELTWDVMPKNRNLDYISISFDGTKIMLDDTTLEGTLNYEYIDRNYSCGVGPYCVLTSQSTINPDPLTYDFENKPDNFSKSSLFGVVMEVDLPNDNFNKFSYRTKEVKKITVSLEAKFRVHGGYTSFKETDALKFVTDYRHSRTKLSLTWDFGAEVTLDGPAAGLSISPSFVTDFDKSRYSSIQIDFN